jgi:hypothetical protein
MRRNSFFLLLSFTVVSVILLATSIQIPAMEIQAGPLAEIQQQIHDLNSVIVAQQEQIDALKSAHRYFDTQEYNPVDPGIKVYKATRFIKTPSFTLDPYNQIFGTLTIEQKYQGEKLVLRWAEVYDGPSPRFFSVPPPNPYTADYLYDVTPEGIVETGFRFYNLSGVNSSTARYEPGLLVFPYGRHAVGDMWGGAYIEKFRGVSMPEYKQFMSRMYQYAIVGIETVTVPAGTFTDCIKIARYRGNGTDRIGWYAKGIGAVKFIFTSKDLTENNVLNGIYELEYMTQ